MLPDRARIHLEKYWSLSREFFTRGDYALGAFFAITLIEEVGKVAILVNEKLSGKLDKKGFRSHEKKYYYAVGATLLTNSRVARIYGDKESRFGLWFQKGKLFQIRNNSLYLERQNAKIVTIAETISKEYTFLLVCIAGEVFAESQGSHMGTGVDEWKRIVTEVDAFRDAYGV